MLGWITDFREVEIADEDLPCMKCSIVEFDEGNEMLFCDNEQMCRNACHLKCCNLKKIPKGTWFCSVKCKKAAVLRGKQKAKL